MRLRTRLILSYVVIIVVSLSLAFLTLILVTRPLQNRLQSLRLGLQSRRTATHIELLYRRDISPEQIYGRLNSWAEQNQTRLLILDGAGHVVADSQDVLVGRQFELPQAEVDPSFFSTQTGTLTTADGQKIMVAAAPFGPDAQPRGYVAAIAPQSTQLLGIFRELSWGFVVAGFVALLLSLLLSLFIARSIAKPLQSISHAAGAVAAGDYQHRLDEKGPREIKRVAASFNVMVEQVQNSQRAMRDFVSNVSHELKTPLTSIQGFSQAIMEGATPDEAAQRRAAGIIHQEAGRMARLVEDFLDLARIDSGQVVMNKTPLNLAAILTAARERLLPQAAAQKIKLINQGEPLPQVVGDGDRLAQVFTNLLDNAIRHTPAGGEVTISAQTVKGIRRPRPVRPGQVQFDASTSVSEHGNFIEISIADTGPGIPPNDLARIFERFYQVDKSRKRGRGTGLGLAIAKEIIEAHSGYLKARSEAGKGTTFMVGLPLTEADAPTQISARSR